MCSVVNVSRLTQAQTHLEADILQRLISRDESLADSEESSDSDAVASGGPQLQQDLVVSVLLRLFHSDSPSGTLADAFALQEPMAEVSRSH